MRISRHLKDFPCAAGLNVLYGFGVDYSDRYPEEILGVTKEDVVRVAQKYLQHPVTVRMVPQSVE